MKKPRLSKFSFPAGHWISPAGEIIPATTNEHNEIAKQIISKRFVKEYTNLKNSSASLSDYEDFLTMRGWITERNCAFFCNKLDRTTKDNIFIAAKELGCNKITVEASHMGGTPLFEQPPEDLYEGKFFNESILYGWIDPNGKFYSTPREQHYEFAEKELDKLSPNTNPERVHAIFSLMKLGWIRVNGSGFQLYRLTRNEKDLIFMFAKDHNMKYIWVDRTDDDLDSHDVLVGEEPEKLYEYHQQWSKSPIRNKKEFEIPEDQDCPDGMIRTIDGHCQETDVTINRHISEIRNTIKKIISKCR
jgi:hypothetical protein